MNYKNLVNEVNKYNKETSDLIGSVNVYDDPKKAYLKKLKRMRATIHQLCSELARMETEKQRSVIQMDHVDWNRDESISSIKFRIRYLILVLQEFETKFHYIIAVTMERKKMHKEVFENAYFEMDYIFNNIVQYMFAVIGGKSSFCFLGLKTHLYLMDGNPNKKYGKKYRYELVNAINELRSGLHSSLFKSAELPDDIAIDTIVKLAFMLATGSRKLDHILKFSQIEGCKKEDNASMIIRSLGKAIIQKSRKKKDRTPGFRIFVEANPRISLKFGKTTYDEFTITGYYAIMYLKFICSDKNVSEFINTMVKS